MQTAKSEQITAPAIGEIWPVQGGIYAGIRQYPDGLRHVVFAAEDVGSHEWGGYRVDAEATSRVDGLANTQALIATGDHPAASAASKHAADGHADFYLPSIGELNHAWQLIPDSFKRDWYWSSTQRSASSAFYMGFVVGNQDITGKSGELRVRPVRSWLI